MIYFALGFFTGLVTLPAVAILASMRDDETDWDLIDEAEERR